MDMLAVDGNSDGMTLELDDLSPELVRGLHALVTDSTNHSKRHRHRSRKDRGSSAKRDSARQTENSADDAHPAVEGNTDAKDPAHLARSQEAGSSGATVAAEADGVQQSVKQALPDPDVGGSSGLARLPPLVATDTADVLLTHAPAAPGSSDTTSLPQIDGTSGSRSEIGTPPAGLSSARSHRSARSHTAQSPDTGASTAVSAQTDSARE